MKSLQRLTLLLAVVLLALGSLAYTRTSKKIGDAWMGVYTQSVTRNMARDLDLKSNRGVVINDVVEDSPAEKAGLEEEDVILRANGTQLDNANDLTTLIDKAAPGDKVTLDIIRDGREKQLTVTLGDREDEEDGSFAITIPKIPKAPKMARTPRAFTFYNDDGGSFVGVSLTDLTSQLGDFFGVKDGNGVLISEVEKDSPAEKAGLRAGDVIVGIDGQDVADSRDVSELVTDKKAGSTVSIKVLRDRQPKTFQVEVEQRTHSHGYGSGYGNGNWFNIPAIPNLDNLYDSDGQGFNREEFRKQMEELREQLRDLRLQLKDNDSWRQDLQKLKEDLKDLQNRVH